MDEIKRLRMLARTAGPHGLRPIFDALIDLAEAQQRRIDALDHALADHIEEQD